jgi:hypothetical protein
MNNHGTDFHPLVVHNAERAVNFQIEKGGNDMKWEEPKLTNINMVNQTRGDCHSGSSTASEPCANGTVAGACSSGALDD